MYHAHNTQISIFISANDHSCASIPSKAHSPISMEIHNFVSQRVQAGAKRFQIIDDLNRAGLQQPSKNQLRNLIQSIRKKLYGVAALSLGKLEDLLKNFENIPDNETSAFLMDKDLSAKTGVAQFKFVFTSKTLLSNAIKTNLLCADTTYKLLIIRISGFPHRNY